MRENTFFYFPDHKDQSGGVTLPKTDVMVQ